MEYRKNHLLLILERLLEREKHLKNVVTDELRGMPQGKLYVREKGAKKYYSMYLNGTEKGISKNPNMVAALKRKLYLENELVRMKKEYKVLEAAVLKLACDDKCESGFAESWVNEAFESNPLKPENLTYMTESGVKVRSKSERTIADKLFYYGIPFRYECAVGSEGQKMYPDFMIMRRDGSVVLWEHFGLTGKQDYYLNSVAKIQKYRNMGFVQHKNLICTWEEDLLDPAEIRRIIERFLL